ncbi:hypothetical protein HY950_02025 [Candidatus Gottesmanbacteria bacterium]|nr:hypothetical protein [Candidatus Gottesmanbacteria bacterium]
MIRRITSFISSCIPFFLVGGILVEFLLTNHLASLGREVRIIDEHISQVREENERLVQDVASASSLLTVTERAKELGFMESAEYLTIGTNQFPFALNVR